MIIRFIFPISYFHDIKTNFWNIYNFFNFFLFFSKFKNTKSTSEIIFYFIMYQLPEMSIEIAYNKKYLMHFFGMVFFPWGAQK